MNIHSVELDGYYARSRGSSTIYLGTAGSHGNEQLQVTLGKGWEDLTVQVVFHPSQVAVQLPANGLLDVPWEATEKPLTAIQGRIVFQGFDQDRLVNSIDLAYTVASHSPALGRDEEPYTPGIVEGVLNQMAADKDAILQAAQQTGQAKEAAASSAGQAAASAAAAGETLTQVQTSGQEAQQKVKDAETEALDKIAAAASALPAVSADAAWQSVTVKPDGSGYNLAALAPIEATIRPTVTGNPAVCENSAAWGLQGLKIYGKSVQNGTPSPENPVPIVSTGGEGGFSIAVTGAQLFDYSKVIYGSYYDNTGTLIPNFPDGAAYPITAFPENSQLTISCPGLNFGYCLYKSDGSYAGVRQAGVTSGKSLSMQGYSQIGLFFVSKDGSVVSEAMMQTVMVNYGDTTAPWAPYTSQPFNLSTPNVLPGIPVKSGGKYMDTTGQQWICSIVDFYANVKTEYVFSETIFNFSTANVNVPVNGFTEGSLTLKYKVDSKYQSLTLCDKFKYASIGSFVRFGISGKNIYFTLSGALDKTQWIAKMEELHPTVVYILDNPVITPLSSKEIAAYRALTTYDGTTVVSTSEPVSGLEVQYLMDGNKYRESVDKRLAALEAAQTGI